jgi:hypothetical protein
LAAALVVGLACSAHAASASAAPGTTEVDDLIARGIDLREHGRDDEALAVFKKALATSPVPRARAQVALAEQALGLWVAAEDDLVLALAVGSDPWITKNRGALEGALGVVRRHLGSLEIRGTDGAEILLDGVRLGALPATAPFRVEAGTRTLEVRANGFHPTSRSVEVPVGGVVRETVTLVPMPAETGAVDPHGARKAGSPTDEHGGDPGSTQRLLGWAFFGTGSALVIAGGVGFLVRKGIVDDYNTQCPGLGTAQPADCDSKISSAQTWLTVSIISMIGGGVFAVGGITLVATAPRRDEASGASIGPVRIGCAPSAARLGAGGSLTCSGTF